MTPDKSFKKKCRSFRATCCDDRQGARQSIGFQFDVKDSMLGAVLKYKDLQVLSWDQLIVAAGEKVYVYHGQSTWLTVPQREVNTGFI